MLYVLHLVLSQVFSLLKSAYVLWAGLLEVCFSTCCQEFIWLLVYLTQESVYRIPGEVNFKHWVSVLFLLSHCYALLFCFVINKRVVGRYFESMEICCLIVTLSQSLISMSIDDSHPNELLWWLPGYNFPTHPFLYIHLFVYVLLFLKDASPFSLCIIR